MLLAAALMLQAAPAATTHPLADNARLAELFDADQHDREAATIDWNTVSASDARRRDDVSAMLKDGSIRTGADYWHAAFIFQHGEGTRDYLIAHTLAVTAVAKGYAKAAWIAAATLDRYLGSVGQPQVYGTQYTSRPGRPVTQEPYDRTLLTDDQRRAAGVPTLAEQERRRATIEAGRRPPVPPRP